MAVLLAGALGGGLGGGAIAFAFDGHYFVAALLALVLLFVLYVESEIL